MKHFVLFSALLGVSLAGCGSPAKTRLLQMDAAFCEASVKRGTAQAFYEFMAKDGIILEAGEHPIKGPDAIKAHIESEPKGVLTWTPVAADVAQSGDLGYTWGTYEFRPANADPGSQPHYGKYVTVWKKQWDGRWKVVLDAGNPGPPTVKPTTN
jgi:ketosteroid isomerase-like protein